MLFLTSLTAPFSERCNIVQVNLVRQNCQEGVSSLMVPTCRWLETKTKGKTTVCVCVCVVFIYFFVGGPLKNKSSRGPLHSERLSMWGSLALSPFHPPPPSRQISIQGASRPRSSTRTSLRAAASVSTKLDTVPNCLRLHKAAVQTCNTTRILKVGVGVLWNCCCSEGLVIPRPSNTGKFRKFLGHPTAFSCCRGRRKKQKNKKQQSAGAINFRCRAAPLGRNATCQCHMEFAHQERGTP